MSNETALRTIFVEGRDYKITEDKVIKINTISVGNIPVVLNLINKYLDLVPKMKKESDKNAIVMKAIVEDFDSVIKLIEITTDLSKEDIQNLNMAALALIATEVISENADFLYQHVLPAFQKVTQSLKEKQKTSTIGSIKSKS